MELNSLSPNPGSRKSKQRIGRGIGSGCGKTSKRGHKGLGQRSGGGVDPRFEGGQSPIFRALPIVGFNCHRARLRATLNSDRLIAVIQQVGAPELVDIAWLKSVRLIRGTVTMVKVVSGKLDASGVIEFGAHIVLSATARALFTQSEAKS